MSWERSEQDEHTALMYIPPLHNPDTIREMSDVLGEIIGDGSIRAMVMTSRHEKSWCAGLDVQWIIEQYKLGRKAPVKEMFVTGTVTLFRRLLTMPVVTIAAINGHAFGNGVVLSCLCDIRFMSSDRGYYCLPEAQMGLVDAFPPSVLQIFKHKFDPFITEIMIPTAKKVTAKELEEHGIIEQACDSRNAVLETALARAMGISVNDEERRRILGDRERWLEPVLHAMDEEDPLIFDHGINRFWEFIGRMGVT